MTNPNKTCYQKKFLLTICTSCWRTSFCMISNPNKPGKAPKRLKIWKWSHPNGNALCTQCEQFSDQPLAFSLTQIRFGLHGASGRHTARPYLIVHNKRVGVRVFPPVMVNAVGKTWRQEDLILAIAKVRRGEPQTLCTSFFAYKVG